MSYEKVNELQTKGGWADCLNRPGGEGRWTRDEQVVCMVQRVLAMADNPESDGLSRPTWGLINKVMEDLKPGATFLDIGCYGGWLYPHLRNKVKYYGIDRWDISIQVARGLWGANPFILEDIENHTKKYDIVFISQLSETSPDKIFGHLMSLAKHLLIIGGPNISEHAGVPIKDVQHASYKWELAPFVREGDDQDGLARSQKEHCGD